MIIGNEKLGAFNITCPTAETTTRAPRFAKTTFVDGTVSATIFEGYTPSKTWDVRVNAADEKQTRLLRSLTHTEQWVGRYGPLQFIPTGGEKQNILTASESSLQSLTGYLPGLVQTTEGPAFGQLYSGTTRVLLASGIPLTSEMGEVTLSAWVKSSSRFLLYFKDTAGATIGGVSATVTFPSSDVFTRQSKVFPVPAGTAYLDIQVAGEITMPAVTAGKELYHWSEGTRVRNVIIEEGESSVLYAAAPAPIGVYTDRSFTITQIGA